MFIYWVISLAMATVYILGRLISLTDGPYEHNGDEILRMFHMSSTDSWNIVSFILMILVTLFFWFYKFKKNTNEKLHS